MSIVFQNLLTPSPPRLNPNLFPPINSRHISFRRSNSQVLHFRTRNFLNFKSPNPSSHSFPKCYESDSSIATSPEQNPNFNDFNLDSLLSVAEFLCIFSSAVVSVVYAVLGWKGVILGGIWRRIMVWGVVGLVGAVTIGAWIRRRQWRRIFVETVKGRGEGKILNLVEWIEKLEEDLRSSVTIIQVLSRQLEKLGIRFRVTRKSLKEPIAQTVALAQMNSEATKALAVQEDILEKELGEIQKVLLAMQEFHNGASRKFNMVLISYNLVLCVDKGFERVNTGQAFFCLFRVVLKAFRKCRPDLAKPQACLKLIEST